MQGANNTTLILIRHGQSNFNRTYFDYLQSRGLDPSKTLWQDCFGMPGFQQAVCYTSKNIDASLSQEGIEQCKKTRELLSKQQIDLILVSPYQRALQTCEGIFGDRDIKIEVHPIVAQVFRYSCDIGHLMEQKMKKYSKYDFSHMKDSNQLWFIQHLKPHHQQTWKNHENKNECGSHEEKQKEMLSLLKDKIIYQTSQELRQRMNKLKDILKEYGKKYKRIGIVSHYWVIKTLIAEQFNENGDIINPKIIQNACPYYCELEHISKFR